MTKRVLPVGFYELLGDVLREAKDEELRRMIKGVGKDVPEEDSDIFEKAMDAATEYAMCSSTMREAFVRAADEGEDAQKSVVRFVLLTPYEDSFSRSPRKSIERNFSGSSRKSSRSR